MKKLNIAKILKNFPKGTKLYSPLCGACTLEKITYADFIVVKTNIDGVFSFNPFGQYYNSIQDSECMLFPSKENRDWNTFQTPFKDGDVITCSNSACTFVSIFKDKPKGESFRNYCALILGDNKLIVGMKYADYTNPCFATEEEKQTLFDAIEANGYIWNAETKTLEKKYIVPKFKVGDRVVHKNFGNPFTITEITDYCYKGGTSYAFLITQQDNFELVPDKFDIATLKPFDKVLVRDHDRDMWCASIFSHTWKDKYFCIDTWHKQCIPYEANKELLGTTNNPKEHGSN